LPAGGGRFFFGRKRVLEFVLIQRGESENPLERRKNGVIIACHAEGKGTKQIG